MLELPQTLIASVARLDLEPGQTLLVKISHRVSPEYAERIAEAVSRQLKDGVKILIVDPSIELSVVSLTAAPVERSSPLPPQPSRQRSTNIMSEFQQIALGDRVVDPISGFKGIAHCVTIWLNGCIRIGIAPEGLDKDGKVQDDRYFDQGQLRILDKGVHKPVRFVLAEAPVTPTAAAQRTSGGPARETSNFRPLSTPTR